jgi:hypothetical protein
MCRLQSPPYPIFLIVEARIEIEAAECLENVETLASLYVFSKRFVYGGSFSMMPAETPGFIEKFLVYVEIRAHSRTLSSSES